jgi:hypothetical protein
MTDKNDNEPRETIRDISEDWNNDIYESLKRLEKYELIIRTGGEDFFNWVKQMCSNVKHAPIIFTRARIMGVNFFLDEFRILLTNIKPIITQKEYDLFIGKLAKCYKYYNGDFGKLSEDIISNQYARGVLVRVDLLQPFVDLSVLITDLRNSLINCEGVKKILYVNDKLNRDRI